MATNDRPSRLRATQAGRARPLGPRVVYLPAHEARQHLVVLYRAGRCRGHGRDVDVA